MGAMTGFARPWICHGWRRIRHSFIQTISIAPLQVHYYSEALPTQHGYSAGISRRSTTCPHERTWSYTIL